VRERESEREIEREIERERGGSEREVRELSNSVFVLMCIV